MMQLKECLLKEVEKTSILQLVIRQKQLMELIDMCGDLKEYLLYQMSHIKLKMMELMQMVKSWYLLELRLHISLQEMITMVLMLS